MIYLDNAATSWPKPPAVARAILDHLESAGGNPGRSGHRLSIAAAREIFQVRDALAELLGLADPLRLIFTSGTTESLNFVLNGFLHPGDHVVTSQMEHNSTMRPLRFLERQGVRVTVVPCAKDGSLSVGDVEKALATETRLVVLNHASNVSGTILPVAEVGALVRKHGKHLLVDAAQTAGVLPIDMKGMGIDFLAFSGHKGLLGPTGTGGLAIGERVDLRELAAFKRGGTGSRSEFEEQPDFLPDKFEVGTPNSLGLAGLAAGVSYLTAERLSSLRQHEKTLTKLLLDGLGTIPGLRLFGPGDPEKQVAVVSFTLPRLEVSEIALRLDEEFEVLCRPGLHCAPSAHRALGSFPRGTVRFSPGPFTTITDIEKAVDAVATLARESS